MNVFNLLGILGFILSSTTLLAEPNVAPFYQQAAQIRPVGKLGQVVKDKQIFTGIPGADAWKIAWGTISFYYPCCR